MSSHSPIPCLWYGGHGFDGTTAKDVTPRVRDRPAGFKSRSSLPGCRFHEASFDVSVETRQRRRRLQSSRGRTMRYMVIVKATNESEAGVVPSKRLLDEMG